MAEVIIDKEVVTVVKGVTINLSVEDAEILYALVGKTNGRALSNLYRALDESGLEKDQRLNGMNTIRLRDFVG